MYKLIEQNRINDTIYFQIEHKRPLATHEISISYDIATSQLSGDVLCYGEIINMTHTECRQTLECTLTHEQLKKLSNTSIYRDASNAYWFATWFKDSAYTQEQAKITEMVNAGTGSVDRKLSKFIDEMVVLYNFEKHYGYKSDYIKALKLNYKK